MSCSPTTRRCCAPPSGCSSTPSPAWKSRAEAANGREAVALARSERADVVLMDIRMPEVDGIQATHDITVADDLRDVKIIMLTTFETDG